MLRKIAELGLEVEKILVGCESGVTFYNKVCLELDLPYGNDPNYS